MTHTRRALETFAADIVMLEFNEEESIADETGRWIVARVDGAGLLIRPALLLPALGLDLLALVRHAHRYPALPAHQRREVAARLMRARNPVAMDWVRAVRLLAASYVFEPHQR